MEDAHSVQLPLSTADKDSAYFGVFDGHGGAQFAAYCGKHLHKEIMSDVSFSEWGSIGHIFMILAILKLKLQQIALMLPLLMHVPLDKLENWVGR